MVVYGFEMITLFVLLILSGIVLLVCGLIEIGSAVFWIFVFVCGVVAMFVEMYMDSRPAKRAPADKDYFPTYTWITYLE